MYKCKECGASFTRRDNLVRHTKKPKYHTPSDKNGYNSESLNFEQVAMDDQTDEYLNDKDDLRTEFKLPELQRNPNGKSHEHAYTPASAIIFKMNELKRARIAEETNERLKEMENHKKYRKCAETSSVNQDEESETKDEFGVIKNFNEYEHNKNEQDEYSSVSNNQDENGSESETKDEGSSISEFGVIKDFNEDENNKNEYNSVSNDQDNEDENNKNEQYEYNSVSNAQDENQECNAKRIYWHNPNKLVDNLRLLASTKEGLEIFKILTELRQHDVID